MKRNEDFRNALGQPDEYFRQAVLDTLDQLNTQAEKENRPQGRTYIRFACACAAMVLLCTGIILACRRPGGLLDNHVDTVNPTTAVLARPSGATVVETELDPGDRPGGEGRLQDPDPRPGPAEA